MNVYLNKFMVNYEIHRLLDIPDVDPSKNGFGTVICLTDEFTILD
ncbi:hypothetical protein A33Q_2763 [Indibacter alkaliphilus LW1]|uniref:Uncharacterized protein n=1 Tax=Indibacter alkaliphilus (strain CCUG 57479 / KCTC 22604 / LW1) TaxID=1189612 RepID=S2DGF0_INDAL|nr:hypothetical protein A33Q_2763 [Indibacter alkaliphilus LW1]